MTAFRSPYSESPFGGSNLGTSSSSSHSFQQTPTGGYLPGYLLGGRVSPTHSIGYGRSLSTPGFPSLSPQGSAIQSYASPQLTSVDRRSTSRASPLFQSSSQDKNGSGPPVESLYDDKCSIDEINSSSNWSATPSRGQMPSNANRSSIIGSRSATPGYSTLDTSTNSVFSPRNEIPQSPAQIDPFYTQGESLTSEDVLDETWITVFGFPPAAVSYILQQFSQYGTIVKNEIPNNGNWLHIQYQTKLQAKKALSKNGKILGGNIMVGVRQCIDKELMSGDKDMQLHMITETPTKLNTSVQTANSKPTTMRPLTAAYQSASSPHQVTQDAKGTPQRNNSIISKTMEYVFGWS